MINTEHKVYIDRSLAFSRVTTWWISAVRGKDGSFAQGRKKHTPTLLSTSGLNMLLYICRLSGTSYSKLHTRRNTEKPCSCLHKYMIHIRSLIIQGTCISKHSSKSKQDRKSVV